MASATNSPEPVTAWRDLMASHARVSEALEHALQERHQISLSEYELLQRLAESEEGRARMQEVADEIHLSQSAVSRLVGRLEDAGLVTRGMCDHDRRGIWACLTDSGKATRKQAAPTYRAVLAETLGG